MTGLEKITSQILEEANKTALTKTDNAKTEAEAILEAAKAESAKLSEEIAKRSETEIQNYKERINSSADLMRRTALLTAKQELITETIEKAYERFCAVDGEEYFDVIKALVGKFAQPAEGEIYFSKKDLDRMAAGFDREIQKIAEEKGGTLTLAKETRDLDGGFILAYGGIEENCSFRALFDFNKDGLQDRVQKILFS